MKTLYTARATTTGGRDGTVATDDKILSLKLARPGAAGATGTNPEQLFAAGYSACFTSAVEAIAKKEGQNVAPVTTNIEVNLNQDESTGFSLSATLDVQLPSLDQAAAEKLVSAAHQMCPYSKATRGNIQVTLKANGTPLAANTAAAA